MRRFLGEREKLWEHKPQASFSTAFSSYPKLSCVSIKQLDYEREISFYKIAKKGV